MARPRRGLSVVFVPPACTRLPVKRSTEPRAISAGTVGRSLGGVSPGAARGQRLLPGMTWVAPLAAVKSVRAQIASSVKSSPAPKPCARESYRVGPKGAVFWPKILTVNPC